MVYVLTDIDYWYHLILSNSLRNAAVLNIVKNADLKAEQTELN